MLSAVALVAVLVSLGSNLGPLYSFLHQHVPCWSRFRIPFYGLITAQVALALLVARALQQASKQNELHSRASAVHTGLIVATGLILILGVGLASGMLSDAYVGWAQAVRPEIPAEIPLSLAPGAGRDLIMRAFLAGLALVLVALARKNHPISRLTPWLLLAVLAIDLGTVSVPHLKSATGTTEFISPPQPTALASFTAHEPGARAHSVRRAIISPNGRAEFSEAYTNFWISWRAPTLGGIHGAFPDVWRPVFENQLTRYFQVLRAFGVVFYASDSKSPADSRIFERVSPEGTDPVYRILGALGRAYTVPQVVLLEDDQKVSESMAGRGFLPENIAFTTDPEAAGNYPGSSNCRLRWVEDQPDHLAIETKCSQPSFLVVADTYFPGWEAWVDGKKVPIHRINLLLRGMPVPAGLHLVQLSFTPEGWVPAMWLTRGALLIWMVLALGLLVGWLMRYKSSGHEESAN